MHLGNEAITPECAFLAGGIAASGLAIAVAAVRRSPISRDKMILAGALGSLVFAAQAVNVPLLPGISAHLVGGVLLAWALGPALGSLTMAVILAVQALAFGDGGLMALGANVLNMALVPAGMIWISQRFAATGERTLPSCLVASLVATLSVPAAALLLVGETALFRTAVELAGWIDFAGQMLASHAWIGAFEGGLTLAVALALNWSRSFSGLQVWRLNSAWTSAAVVLAAVAASVSSSQPDGYEAAATQSGLADWLSGGSSTLALWQANLASTIATLSGHESVLMIAATLVTGCLLSAIVAALKRGASVRNTEGC